MDLDPEPVEQSFWRRHNWGVAFTTQVRVLASGWQFVESPRWHLDRLWFSDWAAQQIIAVDPEGKSEVVVSLATARKRDSPLLPGPLCIAFLPDGRLLMVSGREALLLRRENDGSVAIHADLSILSRNPWNDIVVDGRGNAYVGNAGFDFPGGSFAPGTVALITSDRKTREVANGLAFPNGMAVTPDNSTLIIAESYGQRLTAFDISADGSLTNRRLWAGLGDGYPDGICLDSENAVWYGDVPNRRCVRVREGGEVLATINLDRGCFACALGGADRKTLFMLAAEWHGPKKMFQGPATGQVLACEVSAPGAGWP